MLLKKMQYLLIWIANYITGFKLTFFPENGCTKIKIISELSSKAVAKYIKNSFTDLMQV